MNYPLFFLMSLIAVSCGNPTEPGSTIPSTIPSTNPSEASSTTLRLYPENQRYLEYRGEPLILITSAEHYGAVVNLDFDYNLYLETLEKEGFNYTRIFSGSYIEPIDNIFGIQRNTLAPKTDRYISPWLKENGKYDLRKFNPDYFSRLKDFIKTAGQRGIIVEITLFTSIYAENSWALCPFNSGNNLNNVGDMDYHLVNTLFNGELVEYQELFIRQVVRELNGFDNIFFEVQNEPWSDNPNLTNFVNQNDRQRYTRPWQKKVEVANAVALNWQKWVASIIENEESQLPKKHLIAQNISNFVHNQEILPDGVSIINFHYALPEAAFLNRDIGGVIGLDETGFMPHEDMLYINQAWRFIISGGGLYNNLDYSFTAGKEDGTWPIPDGNPGWGGNGFRQKLSYLVQTMKKVPFHEMEYSESILKATNSELVQHGLRKPGTSYLVFLENYHHSELIPDVPEAEYKITWLNVASGEEIEQNFELSGSTVLASPFFEDQAVLLIQCID